MTHLKKLVLIVLASLAHLSFSSKEKCTVQFDGIYTASVDDETDAHIRFYSEGVVIVSTSVKSIKDVSIWFKKENKSRILSGKYKIKGCKIKFSVKGETGSQKFSGTINGTALNMHIIDGATKAETNRTYSFVSL